MSQQVEIGRPEGRTSYTDYAERYYEDARGKRESLSASEYVAVVQGFLREFVCMGQCNLYIGSARDPEIKEAIKVYLEDVCNPNIHEMKKILEDGGYKLPAPLEEATSPNDVEDLDTNAINDRMITIAQWFGTRGFMTLWQNFAAMSQRTDVRDAFIRNFHRANRWHVVFHEMAVARGHMSPLPTMDAKGLLRTTTMGG
jgi:predicted nucleotidyltransferase